MVPVRLPRSTPLQAASATLHISTTARHMCPTKRLTCLALTRSLSRSAMSLHSLSPTSTSLLTPHYRKTITVQAPSRGCHLITDAIYEGVPELGTPRQPPSSPPCSSMAFPRPWCPNQTLLSRSHPLPLHCAPLYRAAAQANTVSAWRICSFSTLARRSPSTRTATPTCAWTWRAP